VEKTVDFFRELSEEIQNSSLAKIGSLLIYKATPYLSIEHLAPQTGDQTQARTGGLAGVIHKLE
jgi:hypothetical protein